MQCCAARPRGDAIPVHPGTAAALAAAPLGVLIKRCRALGVCVEAIDSAIDSGNPTAALAKLLGRGSSSRAELAPLKFSALSARAKAQGVGAEALAELMDADDPKEALITLLLSAPTGAPSQSELRDELMALKLSELKNRAVGGGASLGALEQAMDEDQPKKAVVELVLAQLAAAAARVPTAGGGEATGIAAVGIGGAQDSLRAELAVMRISQLKRRAVAAGAGQAQVDDADDADEPRAALIELLLKADAAPPTDAKMQKSRPHFGIAEQRPDSEAQLAAGQSGAATGRWAMLSYQWDHQAEVVKVRQRLSASGISVWMDIDGGMSSNLYDSMVRSRHVQLPSIHVRRNTLSHPSLVAGGGCGERVRRRLLHVESLCVCL